MRFFFLYLLTSFFYFHSIAQNKKTDEFNFSKFHKKQFSLKKSGKVDFAIANSDYIQIMDWRADSSAIGFQGNNYFTIEDIRRNFKSQLLSLIDFKNDPNFATSQVIVCLKKIWVTYHLTEVDNKWKSGILWKVECFKKLGNTFSYLCDLDTTIENQNPRLRPFDLVNLCLQLSAEKIEFALHQTAQTTQHANLNQFKYHFDDISILQNVEKKKGLYMNYEQFLNNTPSPAEFEVEKDKLTDGLFVINSRGAYELVRNIWGYCDGQNIFIKSGEKYYPLCKVNHTFYFYGAKHVKKSIHNDPGTDAFNPAVYRKITKFSLPSSPFQLDIINGDVY